MHARGRARTFSHSPRCCDGNVCVRACACTCQHVCSLVLVLVRVVCVYMRARAYVDAWMDGCARACARVHVCSLCGRACVRVRLCYDAFPWRVGDTDLDKVGSMRLCCGAFPCAYMYVRSLRECV